MLMRLLYHSIFHDSYTEISINQWFPFKIQYDLFDAYIIYYFMQSLIYRRILK